MVTDEEVQTALTLLGYKHTKHNKGCTWRMAVPGVDKAVGQRAGDKLYYSYIFGSYSGGHNARGLLHHLSKPDE